MENAGVWQKPAILKAEMALGTRLGLAGHPSQYSLTFS